MRHWKKGPRLILGYDVRLEHSDFFRQWTKGKMKIQLKEPAVNFSKLTGGKNKLKENLHN